MEQTLRTIIEGISNATGNRFFQRVTRLMGEATGADYTFIALLNPEQTKSATIALYANGEMQDNFEYDLADTPCQNVADNSVCMYPCRITDLFPEDQLLIDMGIEGYIGTPLYNSRDEVMGLTVALYTDLIEEPDFTRTIFEFFAGRIAAEIEHMNERNALMERIQHLENQLKSA